ncbi:MAG: STAS domain-containing protein [Parabacteroides sp.]|nr:STAS domain-containing protein [Parabacteroides sp.]
MEVPEVDPDDTRIFHVSDSVLKAEGDIYWESVNDFEKAAKELIESEKNNIVTFDLTQVSFIASNLVGSLSALALMAGKRGKKIKILISDDVSWLFDIMGELDMVELEVL